MTHLFNCVIFNVIVFVDSLTQRPHSSSIRFAVIMIARTRVSTKGGWTVDDGKLVLSGRDNKSVFDISSEMFISFGCDHGGHTLRRIVVPHFGSIALLREFVWFKNVMCNSGMYYI